MEQWPVVSVAIINYNGAPHLEGCLSAVLAQSYQNMELFVIDNASTDGSADDVAGSFPEVRLIRNEANQGFCRAFNQGVRLSIGEFVMPLNPDVLMSKDFVACMVAAARQGEEIGAVSGKLLRDEGGTIDSTGLLLGRSRRPKDRGQGERDRGQYDQPGEVFAACGAAPLYRREMLEDVAVDGEYMDESFFVYYDDVDLGWRARLLGWRCVYAPEAIAYHLRGGHDRISRGSRSGDRTKIKVHAIKNRYLMIVKNDSFGGLVRDLPFIALSDVPRAIYIALFWPKLARGWLEFLRLLPLALRRRQLIKAKKRVTHVQGTARREG